MSLEFITDRQIYERVICEAVPSAKEYVWIGTADMKDLYVPLGARRSIPFLGVLSGLVDSGVSIRLIHAKEPGKPFREDFDRYPNLIEGLEQILCPRAHFKCVVVDGVFAYTGSANLTGAGMGAKSERRRNFESGIVSTDRDMIDQIMAQFDGVWMGKFCKSCSRKRYCADYRDLI